MTEKYRMPSGGRIDRFKPLRFTFDGRGYQGYSGDTLASALIANGQHLVGRSYKYHRPRGIVCAGSEEPNALVTIKRTEARVTPNIRATEVELYEGLCAFSQNKWPTLSFDIGAISTAFRPMLGAGFYYKTFMGPNVFGANRAWTHIWEPMIRRFAGLGVAPQSPDPDRYTQRFAHCDVLVVGAGPAGLAAARAVAAAGASLIVCDEGSELGGSLLANQASQIEGGAAAEWVRDVVFELSKSDRVTLLPRTQAFGYYAQNLLALTERLTDHLAAPNSGLARERLWQVRAKRVILATGALERPLVFENNDRPGVMLCDAASTYLNRYGVRAGTKAVIVTACDSAYQTSLDLKNAGVDVRLIADLRPSSPREVTLLAEAADIKIEAGVTAIGTRGRLHVSSVDIGYVDANGSVGRIDKVDCDLLLMSGGWTPSVQLYSQSGGKLAWHSESNAFLPSQSAQVEELVGACRGVFGIGPALADGYAAGERAASAVRGGEKRQPALQPIADLGALRGMIGSTPGLGSGAHAFVDFQHDVTVQDLDLATQEGFWSIEHIKRYTTTGMATDQGKTSNINAMAIVAQKLGKPISAVGLTTFRPPYTPVTFGAAGGMNRGSLFEPVRRTPMHDRAERHGAVFEDVGLWKRARYFPRNGETPAGAVARECLIVRTAAGIFDASTLGKIEIAGPDAAEFLDRMYVGSLRTLGVGRCRYSVLCGEDGFIIDDGIIGRLSSNVFHVTTTTGAAARVLNLMEDYRQTEFGDLAVWLTSTTEQWAVIAVQGPKSRDILAPLVEGIDLAANQFGHMCVREGRIAGVKARLFRLSFTGELGFEVNVPADFGDTVWELIESQGRQHGACIYGTEAMHVLRAEKGYIIVGQETDGTVTPVDIGLGDLIGRKKRDFIGRRSIGRAGMSKRGRKQLVGLLTADAATVLEEGSQITGTSHAEKGSSALGHVTSSYWSATLGRSIALALVADGRERIGQTLYVPTPGRNIQVTATSPIFFDPQGERLRG